MYGCGKGEHGLQFSGVSYRDHQRILKETEKYLAEHEGSKGKNHSGSHYSLPAQRLMNQSPIATTVFGEPYA